MKCPNTGKEVRVPMLGVLIALLSSCLFGLCNAIVKQVTRLMSRCHDDQ